MAAAHSKSVVYAAAAGNLMVALTKFAAAWWTGSSAMFSEAIHSVVDTGNQGLLLYGMRQAKKTPDASHPLGYGRELYFWSFIVALLVFWLLSLKEMGTPDFGVTADTSLYSVFRAAGGGRTYLAYNAGATPLKVTFSDGTILEVAPHSAGRRH